MAMHDELDSPSTNTLSNGFAFLMLAAGFMAICTSGVVQLAAIAAIFAAGTASIVAAMPKETNDLEWQDQGCNAPPLTQAETPAASQQPSINPEKSWVESLDREKYAGRYH